MIDQLPPEVWPNVARYLAGVTGGNGPAEPVKLGGLWRGIEATESTIAAVRREMWAGFASGIDG